MINLQWSSNINLRTQVEALVADLEAKLGALVRDLDAAIAEKEAVLAEAAKCQSKLDMAQLAPKWAW